MKTDQHCHKCGDGGGDQLDSVRYVYRHRHTRANWRCMPVDAGMPERCLHREPTRPEARLRVLRGLERGSAMF